MNRVKVGEALLAVEAKARAARAALAAARAERRRLEDDARRLTLEAATALQGLTEDPSPADLRAAARRQAHLDACAARKIAEALSWAPEIAQREAALRAALREEIAWGRLKATLDKDAALHRNAKEEESRSALSLTA